MIKLLIDADPIVYRSGFASQQTVYEVVAEDKEGKLDERHFQSASDRDEWLGDSWTVLDETKRIVAEPVENALQIVGTTIQSIRHAVEERFNETDIDMRLVLSGPGNYRLKIATIKPYKGNRDPSHIPVHYQAIRNYLTEVWNARVISGREADDEVSIRGWELWSNPERKLRRLTFKHAEFVVASIDKDLDQIPGWHYDYMKKVFYTVIEEDARKQLWVQILAGDSGDNVPGCWKIGVGKAAKLVQEWIDKDTSDAGIWDLTVREYRLSQSKKDCPYIDKDPLSVALETAQLVYMQRKPGELWMPPGTPFGVVKGDHDD